MSFLILARTQDSVVTEAYPYSQTVYPQMISTRRWAAA
jgi:hypothetical protein